MSGYRAAIRALRENYDVMDTKLRCEVDAQCAELERKHQESVSVGRKPLPANRLRSRKILLSLNESEFARIFEALAEEDELAAGIRNLALSAADAIVSARKSAG